MKIHKLVFNIHCTRIHVCPIPILQVFGFRHCFPGFCKTVIIQDQAHSTGSASHFVSFELLKRRAIGEMTALSSRCISALASGTAGQRASWLSPKAALPIQLCSQDLGMHRLWKSVHSMTAPPETRSMLGCCTHPLHAQPSAYFLV